MITNFKIFEEKNIDKKHWFALMVDNEDVEEYYNKVKLFVDNIYFYNSSSDNIFFLINVDNNTMEKINIPNIIKCSDDIKIKEKLDDNNDIIPDIEEWIKKYKIKKEITKYNL